MTFVQFVHGVVTLSEADPVFWGCFVWKNTISRAKKIGVKKRKSVLTNRRNFARIRKRSCGAQYHNEAKRKMQKLEKSY